MESVLVFPYFLFCVLGRMGICDPHAEWIAMVLAALCIVCVTSAPFHRRSYRKGYFDLRRLVSDCGRRNGVHPRMQGRHAEWELPAGL